MSLFPSCPYYSAVFKSVTSGMTSSLRSHATRTRSDLTSNPSLRTLRKHHSLSTITHSAQGKHWVQSHRTLFTLARTTSPLFLPHTTRLSRLKNIALAPLAVRQLDSSTLDGRCVQIPAANWISAKSVSDGGTQESVWRAEDLAHQNAHRAHSSLALKNPRSVSVDSDTNFHALSLITFLSSHLKSLI